MVIGENDAELIIIQQRANWRTSQIILKGRLARLRFYFICRLHANVTLSVYILQSYFFNSVLENKALWKKKTFFTAKPLSQCEKKMVERMEKTRSNNMKTILYFQSPKISQLQLYTQRLQS